MVAGVVDTGDNLSPEPLIRECEMSNIVYGCTFSGGSNGIIGDRVQL